MGSMALKRRLFFLATILASCLAIYTYNEHPPEYFREPSHNYDWVPCKYCSHGQQCPTNDDEAKLGYPLGYSGNGPHSRQFHGGTPSWDSGVEEFLFVQWKLNKASAETGPRKYRNVTRESRSHLMGLESPKLHPINTTDTNPTYLATLFYVMAYLACMGLLEELLGSSDILIKNEMKARVFETVNELTSCLSSIKGQLKDRFDLLTADISSRLHEKVKTFPWETKYKNMCDPAHWRCFVVDYFVYPAFQLLASYSQLYPTNLPDNVWVLQLAEAGFRYTGEGCSVQCQGCQIFHEIEFFKSNPSDSHYHKRGCQYVQSEMLSAAQELPKEDDSSLSNYESCASDSDGDDIETDSAEPSLQEFLKRDDNVKSTARDAESQENGEALPHTTAVMQQPEANACHSHEKIPETAKVRASQRSGNDSMSTSSSSGYTSASSSTRSSVVLPEDATASSSSGSTGDDDDEGFVDTETFKTEAEVECSKHDQVPPVLTVQCQKNKGHYAYFPIRQLELKYIPSHARYQEVLEFLKLAAMLTVRIVVNITSEKRPEDDPARTFQSRLGTGSCFERQAEILNKGSDGEQPGKWNSMKKLFSGKKIKPGRIYVETTRHVVFDDIEAQSTEVEFFYDHPNRKEVVCVRGMTIEHSRTHGNYKSILTCKTSDLGLVERLILARDKMMKLFRSFSPAIKEGLLRRIFIIGHPHGGEKVLSYGDSVMIKYALTKQMENGRTVHGMVKISNHQQVTDYGDSARKVLLYTADTCQGSSGSPIITFKTSNENDSPGGGAGAQGGQEVIQMELWMHNGVDIKHGLGGSVMKELTAEDIANHGKPSGTRSSVQDNMSRNNGGDGQSSYSEVVSCPVFTVVGHPSYPAYVAYQSRLDSYNEWRYHQIHSPVHLAEAGFFYAGYADCVRCFQCGLGLRSWKEGDDVYVEHYKNRPNCQFLQMQLRVRGIDDPETQLRPQAQENISVNPDRGFDGNGTRGNEMPKISMMVQQTSRNSEEAVMTQVKTLERDLAPRSLPVSVVGFVTDSPAVQGRRPSERETHHPPGAASSSGVARGEKDLTYILLERENQFLQKQLTCKVCFRKPIKDLFLPCGELYACTDCSKLLTHCPSCQKQILATVTTYFT